MIKRKSIVRIRLRILAILRKLPMTTYDVSRAIGVSYRGAKTNLEYLEMMGKVERYRIEALDKELWRLKA